MNKMLYGIFVVVFFVSNASFARDNDSNTVPDCLDNDGKKIEINNTQVLDWEKNTANQFLARSHVKGMLTDLYPDKPGHNHFAVRIGARDEDVEVVYDFKFGKLPKLEAGMTVEVCGDYITSTAQAGPYPPSPDDAIIHWVHRSDKPAKHPSGFTIIDGVVYGQK